MKFKEKTLEQKVDSLAQHIKDIKINNGMGLGDLTDEIK